LTSRPPTKQESGRFHVLAPDAQLQHQLEAWRKAVAAKVGQLRVLQEGAASEEERQFWEGELAKLTQSSR
jgi:hypothetical protein